MRKVCVVTGTRAEYGLLKPIMDKINSTDNLSLQTVVTGSHLIQEFGDTAQIIIDDGFTINARVPIVLSGDSKEILPHSIGHGIIGFSQVFEMLDPDIVLVLGDRYEILAAAIAASYGGRILAHIHGGDILRAGFDEYTRHAITKISHIHFPATEKSAERIRKLGENPENIIVVGSPSIETIRTMPNLSRKKICHKFNLKSDLPILLFVLHPISTHPESAAHEMKIALDSVVGFPHQIVLIYPNVDPGGKKIIDVIQQYKQTFPDKIHIFKNLVHTNYLNIMKNASIMVGNSSSGIIESSAFHLPVVNIGKRQEGRERADNVIDVDYDINKIKQAIDICSHDEDFKQRVIYCVNPYGKGLTSDIICNTLINQEINFDLINKSLNYD